MAIKFILDFEKPIVELEGKIDDMKKMSTELDISEEIKVLENKVEELRLQIYNDLTRWQRVQIARHPERPLTLDYINECFDSFTEFHGDRYFGDDAAIVAGIARLDEFKVMIVGHQKGRDTKSNLKRNFGMPNPEGYRKANRLFELANKFKHPIITFLDTPGAFPGLEAEERGQAEAIASSIYLMFSLGVPVISMVIGEGGSGGALAIGVGNRILMLENANYAVISPEGCAAILWRNDPKGPALAADALKLISYDLLKLGVVDEIIQEPFGGAHRDWKQTFVNTGNILEKHLKELQKLSADELRQNRYQKFRNMGVFEEKQS